MDHQRTLLWGASGVLIDYASTGVNTKLLGVAAMTAGEAMLLWSGPSEYFVQKIAAGTVVWPEAKTVCAKDLSFNCVKE